MHHFQFWTIIYLQDCCPATLVVFSLSLVYVYMTSKPIKLCL